MSKLGEDIRAAKKIYEFFNGETTEVNVNLWMKEAKEYAKLMRAKDVQEAAAMIANPQYKKTNGPTH